MHAGFFLKSRDLGLWVRAWIGQGNHTTVGWLLITSMKKSRVGDLTDADCALEGRPDMTRLNFLQTYLLAKAVKALPARTTPTGNTLPLRLAKPAITENTLLWRIEFLFRPCINTPQAEATNATTPTTIATPVLTTLDTRVADGIGAAMAVNDDNASEPYGQVAADMEKYFANIGQAQAVMQKIMAEGARIAETIHAARKHNEGAHDAHARKSVSRPRTRSCSDRVPSLHHTTGAGGHDAASTTIFLTRHKHTSGFAWFRM